VMQRGEASIAKCTQKFSLMGEGEMRSIPDEFSAAGLMVPEPSIMPFPRPPFDKAETGCDIEYMPVTVRGRTCGLLWSELQPSRGGVL